MKKRICFYLLVFLSLDMCLNTVTREQKTNITSVATHLLKTSPNLSPLLPNYYYSKQETILLSINNDNSIQEAGFNIGWLKKAFQSISKWKFFKSIGSRFRKLLGVEEKKSTETIKQLVEELKKSKQASEIFTKTFEDLKSNEEVSTKVSEYLEKVPHSKYNTVKTIKCLKQDADEIRFIMRDGNIPKADKIIKLGTETIKLFEYDINNMREFHQIEENGVEYVYFRIPKYPQYVLDGKSNGRVYQSMVFGLPKDSEGNWEKFRAFLIDLFTHPIRLWDEWQFRRELSKFNINSRDVLEIEEYLFANNEIKNDDSEFFENEVA